MFKITGFDWLSQFKAILTHNELDQGLWDELEELFILSDIGIHSTQLILDNFKKTLKLNKGTFSIDNAIDLLKKELVGFIDNCGTTELISLILPACVFLALPHIFSKGLLIATDLFSSSIGRKVRGYKSFVAISLLLTTLFWCVAMLMGTIPLLFRAVQNDEFTGVWGDFIAPVWPSKLAIVGGCSVLFFLVLRQLYLRYRDSTRVFRDSFCAILLFTILVGGLSICDTNSALGVGSISMLLILIALGLPVAFALMMSALAGIFFMKENFYVAVDTLGMVAGSSVSSYVFSAVPMFVLLGLVVSEADIGRDSLRVVRRMTNALSGGLAVATIIANALFAAITGISIASAAIFSKIAYPSLIDEGYTSLDEIAEAEAEDLSEIEEFDSKLVDNLQERAQDAQLVKALNDSEAAEILLTVEGVDDALAMALVDADIHTVDSLAELAIVELLEIQDIGNDGASTVIMAAREKEGWFD